MYMAVRTKVADVYYFSLSVLKNLEKSAVQLRLLIHLELTLDLKGLGYLVSAQSYSSSDGRKSLLETADL